MATRAYVGIRTSEGSIRYIYNHFDCYPECLGKNLFEHYDTKDKISELISHGDASHIEDNVENSNFYKENLSEIRESYGFVNPKTVDYLYLWENDEWYFTNTVDINFTKLRDQFC